MNPFTPDDLNMIKEALLRECSNLGMMLEREISEADKRITETELEKFERVLKKVDAMIKELEK